MTDSIYGTELKHTQEPLFDRISWMDPISGVPLESVIFARTPGGVPISGALRIKDTDFGYPIVDCVARLTPELARRYRDWLKSASLMPPEISNKSGIEFQQESTVDSFGWQWTWNSKMRSDADLLMRVAEKFRFSPYDFKNKLVLDAGAGAGDQSGFLLQTGADVASIDLSSAIEVVASKLRLNANWIGIQGDITALPFMDNQFDIVYCEGVIQHTKDSIQTVKELCRVTKSGGNILAAHYVREPAVSLQKRLLRKVTLGYYNILRKRLSSMDRFKLLFLTGIFAALNYVPVLGKLLRLSGTVMHYELMPDFKTTWTNTFDWFGNHTFQRIITPQEFWKYFEDAGGMEFVTKTPGVVAVKKL